MFAKPTTYPKLEFSEIAIPLNKKRASSELIRHYNEGFLPELLIIRSIAVNKIFWANDLNTSEPLIDQKSVLGFEFEDGEFDTKIFELGLGTRVLETLKNKERNVLSASGSLKTVLKLLYRKENLQNATDRRPGINLSIEKDLNGLYLADFRRVWTKH